MKWLDRAEQQKLKIAKTSRVENQYIRYKLKAFNEAVTYITVNFDEIHPTDSQELQESDAKETSLRDEILVNEKAGIEKIKLLFEALPQNEAELEQANREMKHAETAKVEKGKKILNANSNISKKVNALQAEVDVLKPAKDVSDNYDNYKF